MQPKPIFVSLKNQKQFDIVNKHGVKISTSCFIAIWDNNFNSHFLDIHNDQNIFYFGFKVSKKFSPKATERNLAKRRIRSAVKLFVQGNNISNGSIVLIPKRNFNSIKFARILEELNLLL